MSAFKRTRFARELRAHMEDWSADACRRPPMWSHWSEGIHPDCRDLAREVQVADEVRLHKHAAHLLSSQVFALNLFLPFREGSRTALSERVSRTVGTRLLVEEVRFEWVPPGALLGELEGDRPGADEPATAVDVVMWSRLADGRRAAVLVEVKLSEDGFTSCNGRVSRWNRRQDVCESAEALFGDPNACYLRRPKGKRRDRRYWEIFAGSHGSVGDAFPGADLDGPCPFAGNAQQPMRNLAIARALEQEGMVDVAWFVLCAHDDNPDVAGHWNAWAVLLPDPDMAPLLPASAVIDAGDAEGYGAWATWMRERYRLDEAE
ncbi:MAG: hypothetical protein F4145_12495 [Boseongicola sp. SB0675_bin_26]|nr:hypothetical protein [Boseongicola sp. SB0675_bin_26]